MAIASMRVTLLDVRQEAASYNLGIAWPENTANLWQAIHSNELNQMAADDVVTVSLGEGVPHGTDGSVVASAFLVWSEPEWHVVQANNTRSLSRCCSISCKSPARMSRALMRAPSRGSDSDLLTSFCVPFTNRCISAAKGLWSERQPSRSLCYAYSGVLQPKGLHPVHLVSD